MILFASSEGEVYVIGTKLKMVHLYTARIIIDSIDIKRGLQSLTSQQGTHQSLV